MPTASGKGHVAGAYINIRGVRRAVQFTTRASEAPTPISSGERADWPAERV